MASMTKELIGPVFPFVWLDVATAQAASGNTVGNEGSMLGRHLPCSRRQVGLEVLSIEKRLSRWLTNMLIYTQSLIEESSELQRQRRHVQQTPKSMDVAIPP